MPGLVEHHVDVLTGGTNESDIAVDGKGRVGAREEQDLADPVAHAQGHAREGLGGLFNVDLDVLVAAEEPGVAAVGVLDLVDLHVGGGLVLTLGEVLAVLGDGAGGPLRDGRGADGQGVGVALLEVVEVVA